MSGDQEKGCGCLCVFGILIVIDGILDPESIIPNILGWIAIIIVIAIIALISEGLENVFNQPSETSPSEKAHLKSPKNVSSPKLKQIRPLEADIITSSTVLENQLVKSEAISPLRLEITQNLNPKKKENYDSFRQELLGHGITCFYHFTDVRNLENIRKCGGLISWSSCETHDVEIPSAGGSDFSRRLDMRYNLHDYVRLSFCDDHPMAYRLKQEGKTLVLLKIRIDVAEWEGTLFSNINATDGGHSHGGTLSDLQKIRWSAVKRNYVSREDEDFKYHQAEILVKTAIPKEFIVNLDNPIYL